MALPADRDWLSFLAVARPKADWTSVGRILCLDPGETTGWAVFEAGVLDSCGQRSTKHPAEIADLIRETLDLDLLVFELYRIRGNKARQHIGSEVLTIQHIGAIKVVADELEIPIVGQSAGQAKGFATDVKLRRWGLYQSNLRHANDAIRHGCYWHLFNVR